VNAAGIIASMRKSVWLLAGASGSMGLVAMAALALGGAGIGAALALLPALMALTLAWLTLGGHQVMERQRRVFAGEPDLFLLRNAPRSEGAVLRGDVLPIGAFRRWLACSAFGHRHLVGDTVRVKSVEEIRATLDSKSCLDGLPFMEEMAAFCGRRARVFRIVDKVYDYGRSSAMRRLDDCVLLVGLRCTGSDHGGCEAACYLIWKTRWLEKTDSRGSSVIDTAPTPPDGVPAHSRPPYHCQYTELTSASTPSAKFALRGMLGPLVVGNVTSAAFATAVATRAFNSFQGWRGGIAYPSRAPSDGNLALPAEPVQAGDWVRIRLPHEIARTLDKNSKNRGLWFDVDMLKFCGQRFQVRGRVQKIIGVAENAMIPMKTPCIILEDVHYTGEFQGFGEQHDYLYWREAWLHRTEPPGQGD
jgi:hypothetical protein